MDSNEKTLVTECYCGKGGEQYASETGYKLCFTCGQHNVPLTQEDVHSLPKLYASMLDQVGEDVFWPYMFNSPTLSVVLDLDDKGERIWRLIPIENGEPDLESSVTVPYDDFFTVFSIISKL